MLRSFSSLYQPSSVSTEAMKSFSRIRRRNMPMPSNQSHTAATDKSSTSTFLLLLTTVQFMLATATTVPPLTARAGRTYRQKYGETSLEGSK